MDRRAAIKNISLAFGYTITAPVLMNILTSCNTKKSIKIFTFLTKQEGYIIKNYIDFIFDDEYFPLVKFMNLPLFIDEIFNLTVRKKGKELFKQGSLEFEKKFMSVSKKKPLKGTSQEFAILFKTYYNIDEEKKAIILSKINTDFETLASESEKSTLLIYHFLFTLREKLLFGYCTSEEFLS